MSNSAMPTILPDSRLASIRNFAPTSPGIVGVPASMLSRILAIAVSTSAGSFSKVATRAYMLELLGWRRSDSTAGALRPGPLGVAGGSTTPWIVCGVFQTTRRPSTARLRTACGVRRSRRSRLWRTFQIMIQRG